MTARLSASYRLFVTQGDRWLEQAVQSYNSDASAVGLATTEAAIASAYFARAAIEQGRAASALAQRFVQPPDVALAEAQLQEEARDRAQAEYERADFMRRAAARDSGRHPAGRARHTPPTDVTDVAPGPGLADPPIYDIPAHHAPEGDSHDDPR